MIVLYINSVFTIMPAPFAQKTDSYPYVTGSYIETHLPPVGEHCIAVGHLLKIYTLSLGNNYSLSWGGG